ncbi:MAG: type II toxin-antitoxin system VapC family toxin [bacterium]|nr:type II toxin-antitoxin system VapC family toxin [bacterium]
MKYLLDTNTCIRYINGRAPQIRIHLLNTSQDDIAVCSIVKAEMTYGALKSQYPETSLAKQHHFLAQFRSLPFDDDTVFHYGKIRANLEKRGIPIGHADIQIASIALRYGLILVTHNTREFSRVEGLVLADWEI